MFADKWVVLTYTKKYKEIISDKQRYRQMTDHTKQAKTGKCQTIQANDRPYKTGKKQANVRHMDLCSTKHTCSNSACQMFADKWVVLTNTKKV